MRFQEIVLAVLPKTGGMTYPELRKALNRKAKSQIGAALLELEKAGLAKRERIPPIRTHDKGRVDLGRVPRVQWGRIA